MTKKRVLIGIFSLVIIFIAAGGIYNIYSSKTKKSNNYLQGQEQTAILPLVTNQEKINKHLDKIINDSKYTFEAAYVELNPYKISPLSAIIIYSSKTESEVDVYINNVFFTTMEKNKKHIIPIYGLYENKENIIKLVSNGKTVEYKIKTEASDIKYPLEVEKTSKELNNELYFLEGSMETGLTGWDKEGNLRFYLTELLKMDVEWLDNGHFIIGTDQGNDKDGYLALDRYVGFVEMDYLGKIYNYYTMPNGYDFEEQVLSDGTIMIGGGNTPIYFTEQVIYIFNHKNNKILSSLNLSQLIRKVDSRFDASKLGPSSGKNGFYYDEKNDNLIVSFRNLNALISFSYKEPKINWVFTDSNNKYFQNAVWKDYMLKSSFYPQGQHSPQILANGDIAYFDNNYDRIDVPEKVSAYKGKQSEALIFRIENKKVKLIWSSEKINEGYFTQKYGLFRVLDNRHKLINFGWVINDEIYDNKNITFPDLEGSVENTHGVFLELDENDLILFKAKCSEGKYRIFKHSLYNKSTFNFDTSLQIYNNIPQDTLEEKNIDELKIEETTEWINSLEFTQNTFYTDYAIKEKDSVQLYFINKEGKAYILNYKDPKSSQINRVFNVDLKGRYGLYICINGELYNPQKIIQF